MSLPSTGPAVDWKPPPPKPERPVETFDDNLPVAPGGGQVTRFVSRETCNFKGEDGKKCQQKLHVQRVVPTGFQWDSNHAGGQLMFDGKNVRWYKYCPNHGPNADKIYTDAKKYYRVSAVSEDLE